MGVAPLRQEIELRRRIAGTSPKAGAGPEGYVKLSQTFRRVALAMCLFLSASSLVVTASSRPAAADDCEIAANPATGCINLVNEDALVVFANQMVGIVNEFGADVIDFVSSNCNDDCVSYALELAALVNSMCDGISFGGESSDCLSLALQLAVTASAVAVAAAQRAVDEYGDDPEALLAAASSLAAVVTDTALAVANGALTIAGDLAQDVQPIVDGLVATGIGAANDVLAILLDAVSGAPDEVPTALAGILDSATSTVAEENIALAQEEVWYAQQLVDECIGEPCAAGSRYGPDGGWGRQTFEYFDEPFRVRGYRFKQCVSTGLVCTTTAGQFKPESTAQSHALRRLALKAGGRIRDDLDWEVGKVSRFEPDSDDNPALPDSGWRADIVKWDSINYSYGFQWGAPGAAVFEVKHVANAGSVEAQLRGYVDRFRTTYGITARASEELAQEAWAVKYKDPSGRWWYAWAPPIAGHIYFGPEDDARVPSEVKARAHSTGSEAVVMDGYWLSPSNLPAPIRPRPVVPIGVAA